MGAGFAIFIQLVGIFILSAAIAIVGVIVNYIVSKKEKRKRRALFLSVAPFAGLYVLYFTALLGSVVVSSIKHVDMGVGDTWHTPLSNNCDLYIIDLPEQAFIECEGMDKTPYLSNIQEAGDEIYGVTTYDSKSLILNTADKKITYFSTELSLRYAIGDELELQESFDFYLEKKEEVAGVYLKTVFVLALLVSAFIVYIFGRTILRSK